MIDVSKQFLTDVYEIGNRHYIPVITIALTNGTILTLTENQIMSNGLVIEESVSVESDIEMGSVTIGKCTLTLNNIDGDFADVDFAGALVNVEISLGLSTGTTETFQRGRYIVDSVTGDSVLTLNCLDYMAKFDVDYSNSTLSYPATLYNIVAEACSTCGVTLATDAFLNQNIKVKEKPEDTDVTFRTVISWVAQLAGCNAIINPDGELELRWYDISALNVQKLDALISEDGEGYVLTEDGDYLIGEIHTDEDLDDYEGLAYIRSLYTLNIARDDTKITGIRAAVSDANQLVKVYTYGTPDYAVTIDDNPFLTAANAQTIIDRIGAKIVGMSWRKANCSHFSTPYLQAGDVAVIEDSKGNEHPVIISSTRFKLMDRQQTYSAAADPMRKKAEPFSSQTQMLQKMDTALTQAIVFNKLTTDDGSSYDTDEDIEETPSLLRSMSLKSLRSTSSDIPEGQGLILRDGKIYINADFINTGALNADLITSGTLNADLIQAGSLNGIEFASEWADSYVTGYEYRFVFSGNGLRIEVREDGSESTAIISELITPYMSDLSYGVLPVINRLVASQIYAPISLSSESLAYANVIDIINAVSTLGSLFQVKQYTYAYSVGSGANLNITGTNLGISTPSGYTPLMIRNYASGNNNVVVRAVTAHATGSSVAMSIRNVATSTQSGTVTLGIVYVATDTITS